MVGWNIWVEYLCSGPEPCHQCLHIAATTTAFYPDPEIPTVFFWVLQTSPISQCLGYLPCSATDSLPTRHHSLTAADFVVSNICAPPDPEWSSTVGSHKNWPALDSEFCSPQATPYLIAMCWNWCRLCCWPCADARDAISQTGQSNSRKVPIHTKHPKHASTAAPGHHKGFKKLATAKDTAQRPGSRSVASTERSPLLVKESTLSDFAARRAIRNRTAKSDGPAERGGKSGHSHAGKSARPKVAPRPVTSNDTTAGVVRSSPPPGPPTVTASISQGADIRSFIAVQDSSPRKPPADLISPRAAIKPLGMAKDSPPRQRPTGPPTVPTDPISQKSEIRSLSLVGDSNLGADYSPRKTPMPPAIEPLGMVKDSAPGADPSPRKRLRLERIDIVKPLAAVAVEPDLKAMDLSPLDAKLGGASKKPSLLKQDALPSTVVVNSLPQRAAIVPVPQRRVTRLGSAGFSSPKQDMILPPQHNVAIKQDMILPPPHGPGAGRVLGTGGSGPSQETWFSSDPGDWFPQGMVGFLHTAQFRMLFFCLSPLRLH